MTEDHISLREAAHLVNLSKDTVWLAVQRQELSSVLGDGPSGAQYWLKREEVQAWNERRKSRRRRSTLSTPSSVPSAPNSTFAAPNTSESSALSADDPALTAPPESVLSTPSTPAADADLRVALEVASKTLDHNRDLLAQLSAEKEQRERAERQLLSLANELGQYRRALAEASESLAESRARAQAAELAIEENKATVDQVEADVSKGAETPAPRIDLPTARTGWGSRMRRWLLGERVS